MMVLRKHATVPKPHSLDETFYFEHPDNMLGAGHSRFSFSGPAFVGTKHAAELFNGIVMTLFKHPEEGTPAFNRAERYLYNEDDVGACIAAISLCLKHGGEKARHQAELFYVNRDRPIDSDQPGTHKLKRPICHLHTEEDKCDAIALMLDYKESPFEGGKQEKQAQQTRQAEADVLRVHNGRRFDWGHAKDRIVKHHFTNDTHSRHNNSTSRGTAQSREWDRNSRRTWTPASYDKWNRSSGKRNWRDTQ